MGYEDFTTFTEVDTGLDRIQKTANHVDHKTKRSETTYLYKDYGAAHFTNFTHKIKIKTTLAQDGSYGGTWMLSNDLNNIKALNDASKTQILVALYKPDINLQIKMEEAYNGTFYADQNSGGFSEGGWAYVKVVKSGTSLNAYLYSDAAYSTLVDTLTLTLHADHTFKYLYGCNTYNDGNGAFMNADIENFDLGVEDGSIPVIMHSYRNLRET